VSDEHNFDPKKTRDDFRDAARKFKADLHEQIHRNIHDSLHWRNDKQGRRHGPLVIGLDLRGRGRGGVFMGAILVLVGLAFLLDHMGYVSVYSLWWRFWPLLVVLVGVLNFVSRNRHWGAFLMAAGVLLQLNQLGITHFGWRDFWPLMLIALGILVLWGSFTWSRKPLESVSAGGDPRTTLNEAVVFGGLERRMISQDFQGGDITAIFGGVDLDLTEARMQGNEATLAITAIFGGVELRIPAEWQIAFRGAPIFGGIEDKTRAVRADDPANPLKMLVITGAVIFGGLEIKN
jgi:predicted membrane protein